MKHAEPRWVLRAALCLLTALSAFATPVYAQSDEKPKFREPNVTFLPTQSQYIQWLAGTLIIAGVLAIAFKNPHRTHLD
ncbi:MAG: hypothetical protein IPM18_11440 [Phycisphaerales bacterium]|nr:hypothetical protein [Phycisphaerales bacterium]